MIPLDLHKILEFFQKQGLNAQIQKETGQILVLFNIASREYPLFVRIFEGGELLQLLAFIPCKMKPEAICDCSRLLHLLNKQLDIPGFGIDENSSVIFYRCMLPIKDKEVDETVLEAYLSSIQVVCKSFAPVVASVAFGATSFQEVQKKASERESKSKQF